MSWINRVLKAVVIAGALAAVAAPSAARTEEANWPNKLVRLIVPYAPGGGADAIARVLGKELTELWGQSVVIENKSGAGGNLATAAAAQASPDGYTVYLAGEFIGTNKFLYPKFTYDTVRDFAAISLVVTYPVVIVVAPNSPFKTIGEFIQQARQRKGEITYASPGTGSAPHLVGELFKRAAKLDITHVPYRGAAPALQDLLPGRTDSFFSNIAAVAGLLKDGNLRGLAVTSKVRSPLVPDVPTLMESAFPEFDVTGWYALLAPAATPAPIVEKISADVAAVLNKPTVKKRFEDLGLFTVGSKPKDLETFIKSEMQRWEPVIKDAGIKLE